MDTLPQEVFECREGLLGVLPLPLQGRRREGRRRRRLRLCPRRQGPGKGRCPTQEDSLPILLLLILLLLLLALRLFLVQVSHQELLEVMGYCKKEFQVLGFLEEEVEDSKELPQNQEEK